MGRYTALDDRIVEMVMFAKKSGLKKLIIREPVSEFNGTSADCTSYYYTDEEVN